MCELKKSIAVGNSLSYADVGLYFVSVFLFLKRIKCAISISACVRLCVCVCARARARVCSQVRCLLVDKFNMKVLRITHVIVNQKAKNST